MMSVLFLFSAQSASHLPDFGGSDPFIKKSGHVIGYAILAFLYWRALEFGQDKRWVAWLLVLLYAMTDEFHQSFVSGRHPTIWDVILFDNLGALISLWFIDRYRKQKRPDPYHPIVR
jgi:VanZ family protein